ncbi:MAG TPA: polysaccharide biosynthesis C-terminal domain-containing protein, partial [Longimicrobiaceae bacterium]|nr:polysaccharide biosynthesis C-terminal domain-containing protein [Longimicrobiaceae bacterium]
IPMIYLIFYLGMDVAYMRNTAAKEDDLREQQRAFSMSFGAILLVGGVVAALGMIFAGPVGSLFRMRPETFRYMLAIVYSDALIAVPYAHLRMRNRALRFALLRLLFVAVNLGLNIGLIVYLHWGVTAIFFSNLVGNLLIAVLLLPEYFQLFRPALMRGGPWRALWKYALPIMPAMLAVSIVENGDLAVLNYLPDRIARSLYHLDSANAVLGVFNFNYKLGVAMLLVVQMFRMAWTPFSLQHGESAGAPQLYSRVLTALMLVCSVVFLGVSVLLPVVVHVPWVYHIVKEPSYWQGLPIVPVILLAYMFAGMYSVVTAGLYIERRTDILPWIAGSGAVLNVLICIVASRHLGLVAVAWATPASYIVMAAVGAWQSNRFYPVPFEWGRLVHLAAIVAAIFFADEWITRGMPQTSGSTIALKVGLLLAFPVLLLATRFFRAGEWKAIRRAVRV